MHRDRHQDVGFKPVRESTTRKEWSPSQEQQHQMEAREHARQHGKTHRTHELRSAEADGQIREILARY